MTNTETTAADYQRNTDADGIVTVVIDEPGAKVNTMNDYFAAARVTWSGQPRR